jgi:hypothetical protein
MKRGKAEYEHDVAAMLVGKRLLRVRYFEIRYVNTDSPSYRWEPFPGDLLDFGCDLHMEGGSTVGIMWDSEYWQYGVGVFGESISRQLAADIRVWNVTKDDHWSRLTGKTITRVKVYWSMYRYVTRYRLYRSLPRKARWPQVVELEFEDGSVVFFSASHYDRDRDRLSTQSDGIAVIFVGDSAKMYGIGPYAENG